MVEEDPNEETYYEMGKMSTSSIPVSYAYDVYHSFVYTTSANVLYVCVCVRVSGVLHWLYYVQVKYHVVFFDTPVSRGWVSNFHIHPYTEDEDYNTTTGVSNMHVYT